MKPKCVEEHRFCVFWLPKDDIDMMHAQMQGVAARHTKEGRREEIVTHYETMVHPKGTFVSGQLKFRECVWLRSTSAGL